MTATPQNNPENQEIDLSQISKRIGSFFENMATQIFKAFLFFKRNIIWIGILFVIGAGLGYYLDKTDKVYNNQIIVLPNFNSTDYVYTTVELINAKIEEGDTIFLKEVVGIKEPKKVLKVSISPIPDVYKFIDNKPQNFELIKLMSEDGDIKKVVGETLTSKNYPYHSISFVTNGITSKEKTVDPLLNYLNNSAYYQAIQKEYVNNVKIKIAKNDSIISQIDGFLNAFNNTVNGSQKSDKLIYYNENAQLADVIKAKDELLLEQGNKRIELINLDKIVKDNSIILNILDRSAVNNKMKLILPLFLIGIFVLVSILKKYYKYQMAKINS
ncbi:hypothetical protein [Flavobacterium sp.]|uniref:hypothetical protein n=1 Tax=Flavobacterium sp. TaxID=239 RepID=UPI002FDEB20F